MKYLELSSIWEYGVISKKWGNILYNDSNLQLYLLTAC